MDRINFEPLKKLDFKSIRKCMEMVEKELKEKIIRMIAAIVPNAKIILFGSRARGTARKSSDIDIAIDAGEQLPRIVLGEINSIFEASNIMLRIQVLDYNNIDNDIKSSIDKEGIVWKK